MKNIGLYVLDHKFNKNLILLQIIPCVYFQSILEKFQNKFLHLIALKVVKALNVLILWFKEMFLIQDEIILLYFKHLRSA